MPRQRRCGETACGAKDRVPGYQVKTESVSIVGGDNLQIRSLLDRLQFFDPDDEALKLGISSASWSLFGQVWPSARVLADALQARDLRGARILEIGCGLALPSLVAHRRQADVTASDLHPLTERFLLENLHLNRLPPLRYCTGNWSALNPALGKFDLIVGSDVLYERDQPHMLMDFIDAHAALAAQIMIVDPDRRQRGNFSRVMGSRGFGHEALRADCVQDGGHIYRGQMLRYWRGN